MRIKLNSPLIPCKITGHDLNNLLYIQYNNKLIFAKKNLERYKKEKKPISVIDKNTIQGFFQSYQVTSNGFIFYFNPIEEEKIALFKKIISSHLPYIYYPFPILDHNFREQICNQDYWSQVSHKELNQNEIHFREFSTYILKNYNLKNKIFYDPACSTGKFLSELKEKNPEIITIGSDISKTMIEKARLILDKTFLCNAKESTIPNGYCDFLFIRFLNTEVVKTDEAYEIFDHLQNKVKANNGFIIIFGHTPILLNIPFIASKYNLKIINTIGAFSDKSNIFPYFILKKE